MKRSAQDSAQWWLRQQAIRGGDYPFCSDRQLARRDSKHPTERLSGSEAAMANSALAYLERSRCIELLDALRLHPVDREVARLREDGFTVREIVEKTGLKKWRVERALETVQHRLRAAQRVEPGGAVGWQDVYLAETRRRGR
jgi:hypothetical protein